MTDSPHRPDSGWGKPDPPSYPGYTDPAYANQAPYGTTYQPPGTPGPTRQFSAYPQYDTGYDPYATGTYGSPYPPGGAPPEPRPPGGPSRRWLWVLAGVSVLVVLGLVVALVVISTSDEQTVVAPPPSAEPTFTTPSAPPTTTRRSAPTTTPRLPLPFPLPGESPTPGAPTAPTAPGETETVDYNVDGTGRAISITYVDTGGVLQTEFNVMLPWSKQVELAKPANSSASVNIINFGRELTCSITVAGAVVEHHTGSGLTICGALG